MCSSRLTPLSASKAVFYCYVSMLAASKLGSNVPPNNLQPAPVMTLTGVTSDEFKKNLAVGASNPQPTKPPQQQTACLQGRRLPFLMVI
jgi:hypothetical protein